MTVKFTHKDYHAMESKWKRCRDAANGQDAIHAGAGAYLPRLVDQKNDEYDAYRGRTTFYNATWRTISGLQGMIFRKAATIEMPDLTLPMLEDVNMSGENLHMFALETVEECLTTGRVGIFVDYPEVNVAVVTAADAIALNLRPMLKRYEAESIINWRTGLVNNKTVLTLVVLQEEQDILVDEFETKTKPQYRVLDLIQIPDASNTSSIWAYRVRVMTTKMEGSVEVDVVEEEYLPLIKGEPVNEIPFYFIGVDSANSQIDEPPLIDLVNLNISHYKTNADYEHGCHFTGLPTPVISGYTPENDSTSFCIGSTTAWVFPRTDAKAFYLEFTGKGLDSLEKNLARKENQMAILGARMLESAQSNTDSANTTAINLSGEQSMLASISQSVSFSFTKALTMFNKFLGLDTPAKYALNKEFFAMPMSPLTLTALVAAWQNGGISYDSLFANLKRGEVVDIDLTVEEELAAMKKNPPVIPGGTQVNQDNKPVHEVTAPTQRQLQTPPK